MLEKFRPPWRGDSDDGEVPKYVVEPEELKTPLSPEAVIRAYEHCDGNGMLKSKDRDLVTLLNAVQIYIENHELVDRPGNAFFESLVESFEDNRSLRRPLQLKGNTLFVVLLDEGYEALREDLSLNSREINGIRDAHHIYADMEGLSEWTFAVNVLAIRVSDTRRDALIKQSDAVAEVADPSSGALDNAVEPL